MGHKLDERTMITPALLVRFEEEARFNGGENGYFAIMCRPNGEFIVHRTGPEPDAHCYMFAADMVKALNDELAHDGCWIVMWTDPKPMVFPEVTAEYERWVMLWMDGDGDVRFPFANEEGVVSALTAGKYHWMEQCEAGWHIGMNAYEALELKQGETVKRAMGEADKVPTQAREKARRVRQTHAAPTTLQ